jgi:hypothetical protein
MTAQTTRRHLLKGAAMLTAVPVAAMGGVRMFAVVETDTGPNLTTYEGRIATAAAWLGLEQPALEYDPDEPSALLMTDELVDWLCATGRPMMGWVLSGKPAGYTREAALADRKEWAQEQRFMEAISGLDEVELSLLIGGIKRGQSGVVPFEVALQDTRREIDAYRARKAA